MRVLLTGGAGYIGSACLRWLLKHGHDAAAYDDLSAGNVAAVPPPRLHVGDILDTERLANVMLGRRIDAVVHLAALASVPESLTDPERYYKVNVLGTKSVLDAMNVTGVKRIVFSSTAATFGFDNEMPLREESTQAPVVPYGSTKLAAERLIRDYGQAYVIGHTFLRYFNASGADSDGRHGEARRRETHLIPIIMEAALGRRREVLVHGGDWPTPDGTCIRDYVHVEDLAEAHRLALEALSPDTSSAYNLGSGTGTSIREVLRACEEAVGAPIPHRVVGRRPGDPAVLVASPERIRRELGWRPRHGSIRAIVETAWRWHRSHPEGYPGGPARPANANGRPLLNFTVA